MDKKVQNDNFMATLPKSKMARWGRSFPADLSTLYERAKEELKGIKVTYGKHFIAIREPAAKDVLGFLPSGEHQIIFEKNGKTISCIRGFVSFGLYEIYGLKNMKWEEMPERFGKPKDVIQRVKRLLG